MDKNTPNQLQPELQPVFSSSPLTTEHENRILPEAVKQPAAEKSPVSPAKKRERKLGYAIAGMALLLAAGFAATKFSPGTLGALSFGQPKLEQKIVMLDTRKLLAASTKQIMANKELNNEQMAVVSQKLAINMQKLVTSYRDQGYIILNSNAVIAFPAAMDITVPFAEQLGVTVE